MRSLTFLADSLGDTDRLGVALAESVGGGVTIALSGTLGAGKTRLVQAIAGSCGVDAQEVVSPTFVLVREYRGARTLIHIDAYRIADEDEFLQLGVEEYFDSDAIVMIEWAERVAACLPPERLQIAIDITGERARTFRISALGKGCEAELERLAKRLGLAS